MAEQTLWSMQAKATTRQRIHITLHQCCSCGGHERVLPYVVVWQCYEFAIEAIYRRWYLIRVRVAHCNIEYMPAV